MFFLMIFFLIILNIHYMNIYNLLDRRNEIIVYGDTGRTNETIEKARAEIISSSIWSKRALILNGILQRSP